MFCLVSGLCCFLCLCRQMQSVYTGKYRRTGRICCTADGSPWDQKRLKRHGWQQHIAHLAAVKIRYTILLSNRPLLYNNQKQHKQFHKRNKSRGESDTSSQPRQDSVVEALSKVSTSTTPNNTVIGIYGLPGSGKTYLLDQLRYDHTLSNFLFIDGSMIIECAVDGGIKACKKLDSRQQAFARQRALSGEVKQCRFSNKIPVIGGHLMFWHEKQSAVNVWNDTDVDTYTHIIYLDVPSHISAQRRAQDKTRSRETCSVEHLEK